MSMDVCGALGYTYHSTFFIIFFFFSTDNDLGKELYVYLVMSRSVKFCIAIQRCCCFFSTLNTRYLGISRKAVQRDDAEMMSMWFRL